MVPDEIEPDAESARGLRVDAERNRAAIIRSATSAFAESGSASVDDVAEAAGLTRTTVYRHFPSREALVSVVYVEALEAVGLALTDAQLEEGEPAECFERAVGAILGVAEQYTVLVNGPPVDLGDEALNTSYERTISPLILLAERAQRDGKADPRQPAWWLADCLFGLIFTALPRVHEGRLNAAEVGDLVLTTLWGGIGPRPR